MLQYPIRGCLAENAGDGGRVAECQNAASRKIFREHLDITEPALSRCLGCESPERISVQPVDCNNAGGLLAI